MRVALTSWILMSLAITLLGCAKERDNGWPSYNRSLDGQRYSPLAQITTENVARLKPVCEMAMGEEGGFQTGPVVIGDTMFVTTAHTDGSIAGGVVTYTVRGKQYVAFTSGNVSRGTFDTQGSPKLVILALDAPEKAFHAVALPEVSRPSPARTSARSRHWWHSSRIPPARCQSSILSRSVTLK
jgi:hypothetical protein